MFMNGNSNASAILNNCNGGFDVVQGSGVRWVANYCTGPTVWGYLNPVGTMSGAC